MGGILSGLFGGGSDMPTPPRPRIDRTPMRTARRDNADSMTDMAERRRKALLSGRQSTMLSGGGMPTGTVGSNNTLG